MKEKITSNLFMNFFQLEIDCLNINKQVIYLVILVDKTAFLLIAILIFHQFKIETFSIYA